jgi:hypothetical protein
MNKQRFYEFDREKKIHKVQKGNKGTKHRNSIYNFVEEYEGDYEDLSDELHLDERQEDNTTQYK